MFKPQGGSLHTDENMTMHVQSFCCVTPKPAEKIPVGEVKEGGAPGYSNPCGTSAESIEILTLFQTEASG
jgi:hypothetical protein